jgi:FkbM family methyltransferase
MRIYIQLGAGAGDLDYSADYRDGFSTLIKSLELNYRDRIIVVEANPFNIPTLEKSWKNFPQVEVYNLAISRNGSHETIEFFYAVDDGPFFQIASVVESHVREFCPDSEVKSIFVQAMSINDFLANKCPNFEIELLALDIEGLDLEVLEDLNLLHFNIHQISFEKSNQSKKQAAISNKLRNAGYRRAGSGMDPHNSDVLWLKPGSCRESLQAFSRHSQHKIWEAQLPLRHYIKTRLFKFKSN